MSVCACLCVGAGGVKVGEGVGQGVGVGGGVYVCVWVPMCGWVSVCGWGWVGAGVGVVEVQADMCVRV